MRLSAPVLRYLYERMQSRDLEQRAAATDDGFWSVSGANSKEGFEALQKRRAILQALAAGRPPTGTASSDAIEL